MMHWFRTGAGKEKAPWDGPFGPPAPAGPATINPMVRTAGELVAPAFVEASAVVEAPASPVAA